MHVFGFWEETGAPAGRACKLHIERPQLTSRFEPVLISACAMHAGHPLMAHALIRTQVGHIVANSADQIDCTKGGGLGVGHVHSCTTDLLWHNGFSTVIQVISRSHHQW